MRNETDPVLPSCLVFILYIYFLLIENQIISPLLTFVFSFHSIRPDLVDYGNLQRSNPTHNLQQAFNLAEQKLGVTKLLDPEGK